MKFSPNLSHAIFKAREHLINTGKVITTESWQGIKKPIEMFESFDYAFASIMPKTERELITLVQPNLPWADLHFLERVSGIPHNPPPSHEKWPFAIKSNETHRLQDKFSHTYPERFWPRFANKVQMPNQGIRYVLGDLDDLINLLYREPHTRQAYLPIWFPEDTGATDGQRVPCSLGYLFRVIDGFIHVTYKIRSCDFRRHFRDDIYLCAKLLMYVLKELQEKKNTLNNPKSFDWNQVELGWLKMQIDSLHVFAIEKDKF